MTFKGNLNRNYNFASIFKCEIFICCSFSVEKSINKFWKIITSRNVTLP